MKASIVGAVALGLMIGGAQLPAQAEPTPDSATWGTYTGGRDHVYDVYLSATGAEKDEIYTKVARWPRAPWMTQATAQGDVYKYFREVIDNTQGGDPSRTVQITVFREFPRTEAHRDEPLTADEIAAYKAWMDQAAAAVGDTRAMIFLEPDSPENAPAAGTSHDLVVADPEVRLGLIKYAAQKFNSLPNTSVYLDGGAADWIDASRILWVLQRSGIEYADGLFFGATHRTSIGEDAVLAGQLIDSLAAMGYPGKRAVLDTSDNGRPYTSAEYRVKYDGADYNDPIVCQSPADTICQTLGIPPTTNVAAYAQPAYLHISAGSTTAPDKQTAKRIKKQIQKAKRQLKKAKHAHAKKKRIKKIKARIKKLRNLLKPTTVAATPPLEQQVAALTTYVDAFAWIGRPWIGGNGKDAPSPARILQIARTTPYQ